MPEETARAGISFSNYGPLTTTFTPAPSCTTTDRIELASIRRGVTDVQYTVSCYTTSDWDCRPPGTTTSARTYNESEWYGTAGYYSPGLYCPSGWTTVGMATRDWTSVSTSGFIAVTTAKNPYFEEPATILASLLSRHETMALCCPSSMTPNGRGECHSIVPNYIATAGCQVDVREYFTLAEVTRTYVDPGITRTGVYPVASLYSTSQQTRTANFSGAGLDGSLTAMFNVPMVTIVHHQSDLPKTTETPSPTPNIASTMGKRSKWDGLGSVIGCSAVAMVLGMAIMFL